MISFSIELEVMCRVGAHRNEPFRGMHKMQRRYKKTPVKTNGSKATSSFEKVGNIIQLN